MMKFPENFAWGAATSGPQSEGRFNKRHRNVFDYWYDTDPQAFYAGSGQTRHLIFTMTTKKTSR